MIRTVDAATRIGVLVPGAADVRVPFDDLERNAGFLQTDAGEQARHARADDHHLELRALSPRESSAARVRHTDRCRPSPVPRSGTPRSRRVPRCRSRTAPSRESSRCGDGGSLWPPSRYLRSTSNASARICSCCASVMPPWASPKKVFTGRMSPRMMPRSPVMWTRAAISDGMCASFKARRIVSSSSVSGARSFSFATAMTLYSQRWSRYLAEVT